MNEPDPQTESRTERRSYLIEVLTAIVLGLATVGAAFAGYQSSLYGGASLDQYNIGVAKTNDANAKMLEASQGYTFDMITWMEWQSRMISADKQDGAQAKLDGEIAKEIEDDFMEERLKEALIWSDKESEKKKTFVHPTESPEYAAALFAETFDLEDQSKRAIAGARRANETGDHFTLITVLFTIVLFFGGIATVFKHQPVKLAMLLMSVLLLCVTAVKLFMLPMAG